MPPYNNSFKWGFVFRLVAAFNIILFLVSKYYLLHLCPMSRADSLLRPFGEYEPTISSCKYYHDLCLSFNLREPIKKDDSFVIIEESDRVFKSDHLKFFAIHPSGPKKIMLVFREIKPKN